MKKIGILGGSFDPLHNGHMQLATGALIENGLDFVFFMPAKHNPFKIGQEITNDLDRVNMIKEVIKDKSFLCVLENEIKGDEVSYTYDTMCDLMEEFKDCKLYFILGADSFISLENWYKGEELLKMVSFIVSVRPGYDDVQLHERISFYKEKYDSEIVLIKDTMPDVSSTKIRQLIKAHEDISHLVPREVERYIKENELYL